MFKLTVDYLTKQLCRMNHASLMECELGSQVGKTGSVTCLCFIKKDVSLFGVIRLSFQPMDNFHTELLYLLKNHDKFFFPIQHRDKPLILDLNTSREAGVGGRCCGCNSRPNLGLEL